MVSTEGGGCRIPGGKLKHPVRAGLAWVWLHGRPSAQRALPPSGVPDAAAPGPGRARGASSGLRPAAVGRGLAQWESAFAHQLPLSPLRPSAARPVPLLTTAPLALFQASYTPRVPPALGTTLRGACNMPCVVECPVESGVTTNRDSVFVGASNILETSPATW